MHAATLRLSRLPRNNRDTARSRLGCPSAERKVAAGAHAGAQPTSNCHITAEAKTFATGHRYPTTGPVNVARLPRAHRHRASGESTRDCVARDKLFRASGESTSELAPIVICTAGTPNSQAHTAAGASPRGSRADRHGS